MAEPEPAAPRAVLASGEGFLITLGITPGATEHPAGELPRPDVSRLPGATLIAVKGWDAPGVLIRAGCVSGPSSRYAPGIEEVVFEKATWMTVTRAGLRPEGLGVTARHDTDRTFHRVLEGKDGSAAVRLEHTLAFSGRDSTVIFCSALCRADGAKCASATLEVEGTTAPPPRPSLIVKSALLAAEMPAAFLGGGAAVILAAVALILWRRPYPRP